MHNPNVLLQRSALTTRFNIGDTRSVPLPFGSHQRRKHSSERPFMQVIITAVGPDNVGLADPIIHHVTSQGANIAEIQMYDHDEEAIFAMLCRINIHDHQRLDSLRKEIKQIGDYKNLAVRVWSPDERPKPRLAICTTYRPEPALAVLRAIRDKQIPAEAVVMLGNRKACRGIAEQFGVDWHFIGDGKGNPDENRMVELFDEYNVCLLYTSPSPRDATLSRMPSSA